MEGAWHFKYGGPFNTWSSRIGRTIDIIAHPCSPSPEVWARAWFQALPTLLLTPIKPSPTDYLIVRLGRRHGFRRRFNFDVWDFDQLPEVPAAGIRSVIFRVGETAIKALWWMCLADAMTGYLLNWVSATYQYSGCTFPGEAYYQGDMGPGWLAGPAPGAFRINWSTISQHIMTGGGYYVATNGAYNPSASLSVNTSPWEGAPLWQGSLSSCQLYSSDSAKPILDLDLHSDQNGNQQGQDWTYEAFASAREVEFWAQYTCTPGYTWITGSLSVFGRPSRDNVRADP